MAYTITIDSNSVQAENLVRFLKSLDFVKVTNTPAKKAPAKAKAKTALAKPAYDDLEEDEDGIPIKYREKIMALSKKTNKAIAKRWDEAIARREAEQKKK